MHPREEKDNLWDLDHSAARGRMACRGLYVFAHESRLGNAPSSQLFEKVDIQESIKVRSQDHIKTIKLFLMR
ncbi:type I CRISPR-associated protein Cas7 [Paenibacillus pinihumi]|uniref:type I CRISPR-associated protein Cas7 n=1 Tax=Paenibacillus pinihumi TaxID=669462 RepID=UPI00048E6AEF